MSTTESLSDKHPLPRDGSIKFSAGPHVYRYNGVPVRKSVTGLLKKFFPPFDAAKVIEAHYDQWKQNKASKYSALIKYLTLVQGRNEAFCKGAIRALWQADGKQASEEGTRMHLDFECIVNGRLPPQGETREVTLFRRWLTAFCTELDVEPFRSELIVYCLHKGRVLVAGQVDLVLKAKTQDVYYCVDYKRKDPTERFPGRGQNLLGVDVSGFGDEEGTGPFEGIPADDFYKYCAQLNIYAHIAASEYGIDFRDNLYLLQIHPSLEQAHTVTCARMDDRMEALFALERNAMEAEAEAPL